MGAEAPVFAKKRKKKKISISRKGSPSCTLNSIRGPKSGAFGKPCLCPTKKIFPKTVNMTNLRSTQQIRALLLKPCETTKMTKMAGVTRAKAWSTKGTVFCSLKYRFVDVVASNAFRKSLEDDTSAAMSGLERHLVRNCTLPHTRNGALDDKRIEKHIFKGAKSFVREYTLESKLLVPHRNYNFTGRRDLALTTHTPLIKGVGPKTL